MIGVRFQQLFHVRPPSLAHDSVSNLLPQFLRFNFGVSKKTIRFALNKDGIIVYALLFQDIPQLRPDWIVTSFVFLAAVRLKCHYKCFANHLALQIAAFLGLGRNVSFASDNDVFGMTTHLYAYSSSLAVPSAIRRVITNDVTPIDVIQDTRIDLVGLI